METITKKVKLDPFSDTDNPDKLLYYNVCKPSEKIQCAFCDKEITRYTKIQDAENMRTIMCITCLIEGRKTDIHPVSDSYHVLNKLNFPLYEDNWSAEEEILLLEGMEKYGFGNWGDIGDHIGTDKTGEDVASHYEKIYLSADGPAAMNEVLTSRDEEGNLVVKQTDGGTKAFGEVELKKKKGTKPGNEKKGGSGGGMGGKAPSGLIPKDTGINAGEIIGYMPFRGDFDYEYDNEAELFLAELEFNDLDKPEEVATKMKILEVYNLRLDERIKRKKFVIERDLLDLKKQNMLDLMRTKEEKEVRNLLKVFARFHSADEHEKLIQGIYREKMLRQKIEELRVYKKMGLKTFEEVELYLKEKRNKDEAYQKKQKIIEATVCEPKIKTNNPARRTRLHVGGGPDSKEAQEKKNKFALTQMNEKELGLCDNLGLAPYEFLLIKDFLVRECLKEGFLTKEMVSSNVKADYKTHTEQIFDFLVANKIILEKAQS